MQKKIIKISPTAMGHLMHEFENVAKQMAIAATTKCTGRCPATCDPRKAMSTCRSGAPAGLCGALSRAMQRQP